MKRLHSACQGYLWAEIVTVYEKLFVDEYDLL